MKNGMNLVDQQSCMRENMVAPISWVEQQSATAYAITGRKMKGFVNRTHGRSRWPHAAEIKRTH